MHVDVAALLNTSSDVLRYCHAFGGLCNISVCIFSTAMQQLGLIQSTIRKGPPRYKLFRAKRKELSRS